MSVDSIDYTSMLQGEMDEAVAESARKARREKKRAMKMGERGEAHARSYRNILKNSPPVGEAVAPSTKPAAVQTVSGANAANAANATNATNATNASNAASTTTGTNATNAVSPASGTNGAEGKKEGKQHTKKSQKKAAEKKAAEKKAAEKVKNEEDGWKTITEKKH